LVQAPVRTIIRIEKYHKPRNFWHQITQEFEPLAPHRGDDKKAIASATTTEPPRKQA
jgi:hypothetical protein